MAVYLDDLYLCLTACRRRCEACCPSSLAACSTVWADSRLGGGGGVREEGGAERCWREEEEEEPRLEKTTTISALQLGLHDSQ